MQNDLIKIREITSFVNTTFLSQSKDDTIINRLAINAILSDQEPLTADKILHAFLPEASLEDPRSQTIVRLASEKIQEKVQAFKAKEQTYTNPNDKDQLNRELSKAEKRLSQQTSFSGLESDLVQKAFSEPIQLQEVQEIANKEIPLSKMGLLHVLSIAILAQKEQTANSAITGNDAIQNANRLLQGTLCSELGKCRLSGEALRHPSFVNLTDYMDGDKPLQYFELSHLMHYVLLHRTAPYEVGGVKQPCEPQNVILDRQLEADLLSRREKIYQDIIKTGSTVSSSLLEAAIESGYTVDDFSFPLPTVEETAFLRSIFCSIENPDFQTNILELYTLSALMQPTYQEKLHEGLSIEEAANNALEKAKQKLEKRIEKDPILGRYFDNIIYQIMKHPIRFISIDQTRRQYNHYYDKVTLELHGSENDPSNMCPTISTELDEKAQSLLRERRRELFQETVLSHREFLESHSLAEANPLYISLLAFNLFYQASKDRNTVALEQAFEAGMSPNTCIPSMLDIQKGKSEITIPLLNLAIDMGIIEITNLLLTRKDIDINAIDHLGRTPLICAIEKKNHEIIQALLARADIDMNKNGALIYAISVNDPLIINLLMRKEGIDLNQRFSDREGHAEGRTPLIAAIMQGNTELAEILISKEEVNINLAEFNKNIPTEKDKTALVVALAQNNKPIAQALLRRPDIDVNIGDPLSSSIRRGFAEIIELLLTKPTIDVNRNAALIQAISQNNPRIIQLLINDPRTNFNQTFSSGVTPLIAAVYRKNTPLVQSLIAKEGINLNAKDRIEKCTPLMWAIKTDNIEAFRILINTPGISLNEEDKNGDTALMLAIDVGDLEILQTLLSKQGIELNNPPLSGYTPLSRAIEKGNLEILQILLHTEGMNVNQQDSKGNTPLLSAINKGDLGILQILLSKEGVDVNQQDSDGDTPLLLAIDKGNAEILQTLLAKDGIELNEPSESGYTPLTRAIKNGNDQILQILLDTNDIDVNAQEATGHTPLTLAIIDEKPEIVRLLLNAETIDPNAPNETRDNTSQTPLMWAIEKGNIPIIRLLIGYPTIKLNEATMTEVQYNQTPLMWAIEKGDIEVIRLLIGAENLNINATDDTGAPALVTAIQKGDPEIIQELINVPEINVNIQDQNGRTPLMYAIDQENPNPDIIELLLSRSDIDLDLADEEDVTALELARKKELTEIAQMIETRQKELRGKRKRESDEVSDKFPNKKELK